MQSPPPLTPFHSRLAWVAVINDPPCMSTCGSGWLRITLAARLRSFRTSYSILDAATGNSGLVYERGTYSPLHWQARHSDQSFRR